MITKKLKSISIVALAFIMALTLGFGISSFSKPVAEVNAATAITATKTTKLFKDGASAYSLVGKTAKWSFGSITTGSSQKYAGPSVDEGGIIFDGGSNIKVASSGGISCKGSSSIYIPATGSGTISMTVYGSSDGRYFDLYVNGTAVDGKRLWSKYNATVTADGKKGPQSFNYTPEDLTTIDLTVGGVTTTGTYLWFKDNNTELKVSSFTVENAGPSEVTVTYDANGGTFETTSDKATIAEGSSSTQYTVVSGEPTAPDGKRFAGWSDGTNVYQPGGVVTISKDITLTAVYDTVIYALYNPLAIAKTYKAGLTVADLKLPATVEAKTVEGNVDVAVVWDTTAIETAGFVAGDYVVSGVAQATAGYVYDCETAVSIEVKINETAPKITAIAQPEQVNVLALSPSVELPTEVVATVEGVGDVNLPVEWTTNYDLNAVNEYTLAGTVNVGGDYDLNGQTVSLILNVYALDIVSVDPVTVTTSVGVAPELPSTVKVTLEDATTVDLSVVWATADVSAVGAVNVSGEITLTASYTNTNSVVAEATVNVVNVTTVTWNAYNDQTNPVEFGKKWTDSYPDGVLISKNGITVTAQTSAITGDPDRDQMYPMIQLKSGKVTIVIPENAKGITLKLSAGVYNTTAAKFELRKDGVAVDGAKDVLANLQGAASAGDANNAFYPFTPNEFTYNLANGGTYEIINTVQSTYITNIEISAVVTELAGVTYDAGEGANAPKYAEYDLNSTVVVAAAPVAPNGYKFVCWNDGEADYNPGESFVITGAKTFTAVYVAEIVSVDADFVDVTRIKADVDTAVSEGKTAEEIFSLATSVKGVLIDGTEVDCVINWNVAPLTEANYAVGVYDLSGTIAEHATYPFGASVNTTVSVKIIIREAKAEIASVETLEDIKVELGSENVELPKQVAVTLDDTTVANVNVEWGNDYDLNTANTYPIEGTLELGNEYNNTADLKATVNVIVYNYVITSIEANADVKAFVGGLYRLPDGVIANYKDINGVDKTVKLDVTWDIGTIDLTKAGTCLVTGVVNGTALYVVPAELTASVNVIVSEYVSASTARSTDFTVQHPSEFNRGFTFTNLSGKENGNFAGAKLKNGSVSFALTATANVTFVTYYEKSAIAVSLTKDAVAVSGLAFAPGAIQTQTVTLEAGSYTLTFAGTAGSGAVRAIIIDDGGSEVFLAQSATGTAVLPMNAPKVVNGVKYNFLGWAGLDGTLYNPGDEVLASETGVTYYAVYDIKTNILGGAALRATADKMMRFEANIDMLNADVIYDKLIASGALKVTAEVKNGAGVVVDGAKVVDIKGDKVTIYLVVSITDNTEAFSATFNIAFAGSANEKAISYNADAVAKALLAQVSDTQDTFYQFAMEDGKFSCYTDEERTYLSAYLAPAEIA